MTILTISQRIAAVLVATSSIGPITSAGTSASADIAAAPLNQDTRSRCPLSRQDSVHLSRGAVYRDCAVDRRAERRDRTRLDFTPRIGMTGCFNAEIEFVVDTAGMPERDNARVVRTNERALAQAMLDALPMFRYEPARLEGRPVRQIVSEKHSAVSRIVVVPAGSGRPSAAAAPSRPPC